MNSFGHPDCIFYTMAWLRPFEAVQCRHVFAFLGFFAFLNMYTMRVNLSVAIVAMVNSTAVSSQNAPSNLSTEEADDKEDTASCPLPVSVNGSTSTALLVS